MLQFAHEQEAQDMVTLMIEIPTTLPTGEIVAVSISAEEYMEQYAETHHDWVQGVVLRMSPPQ
jgi:hypothetical protein